MQFSSTDGYKLQVSPTLLPRLGRLLERIAPHMLPPGAESLSPKVLLPLLRSLVGKSSLRRVYTSTDSRRQYPLFTPHDARFGFDLLTVPQPRSDALLLQMLRPHPEMLEMEVKRPGGSVTITWRPAKLLSLLNSKAGNDNGVYILERDGRPLYVGITLKSFRSRWNMRIQVLEQLRLPVKQLVGNDTLWLGTVTGYGSKEFETVLRMVEHTLVRYLSERGPNAYRLSNQMLKRQFIPLDNIAITNRGTVPSFLPSMITISKGGLYELAPVTGIGQSGETKSWTQWPN